MTCMMYDYNLDGELTEAFGASFASIVRNVYTRLPERVSASFVDVNLRYDSFGRRLHKAGEQTAFYHSGIAHPTSDRTKGLAQGYERLHALVERIDNEDTVYVFTPAGQTLQAIRGGYARVGRDHLRSVRVEASATGIVTAHYSAYGEAIIFGGVLRRAFAGYEPDLETGLYNASRRLYSPEMRYFVSVDPRLQSVSPYPYCAEDPFNRIDPTGAISSATIGAIVGALVLLATIVATIVTWGAATPVMVASESSTATGAGVIGEGAAATVAAASQDTVVTGASALFPYNALGFAKFGAGVGFVTAAARNGAELIAKAAQGEHISAWQAVKSMVIEPAVAGMAGGIGGAISGAGLVTSNVVGVLALLPAGSIAASAFSGVVGAAVNGQLKQRSTWASIGISMAEAVGTVMLLTPFMSAGSQLAQGLPGDDSIFWSMMYSVFRGDPKPIVLNYDDVLEPYHNLPNLPWVTADHEGGDSSLSHSGLEVHFMRSDTMGLPGGVPLRLPPGGVGDAAPDDNTKI